MVFMIKYFALSDMHGSDVSITDFLKKGFNPKDDNHHIILMGDYFDRGKFNYEVLLLAETLLSQYGSKRIHLLKGNHDEFLEEFIDDALRHSSLFGEVYVNKINNDLWKLNGGAITVRQLFGGISPAATFTVEKRNRLIRIKEFLGLLKGYHETEEYIFTHAYISENRKVDIWSRNMFYRPNMTGKTVVVGHTRFEHIEPGVVDIYKSEHQGNIAITKIGINRVIGIDDGSGKNVVVFNERG